MPTKRPVAPPDWSFRNVPDPQLQARGSGWFRRYSPGNITARLNRTNPTTRETLSSVETENTTSRKCRAGAKAQHSFRFGLDSLAFNYLIVVLPQAPGFGALRRIQGHL
ncbi:uncharacterized protein BO87DRAFT_430057 [Aspergillus neoniger CBS 115656]|uniref:Uncharacterized protein n=1 Tax=Aspergillus neoniger (strain CBS 115656) TaxID=1448310 RepID=A0A318Y6Y0_ASPNB|nr:hypothetical protein BO87DRAFT_430057 [Aspergillus neoniger CBS 115656]PYH29981.1 hypothetical protein BO87DRAFT_430057 [Aspergillus neoniger CBS 115656]